MTNPHDHPDDLVTLTTADNEFAAGTLVAVLREAGIEAVAFDRVQMAGLTDIKGARVPVQVRAADLERAQAALKQNVADSVDLDWDEVDVGEPEDDLPIAHPHDERSSPRSMPLLIWIGFVLAIILMIGGLAGGLISFFSRWR